LPCHAVWTGREPSQSRRRAGATVAGPGHDPARPGPPPGTGLAGRITLTITCDTIRQHTATGADPGARSGPPAGIADAALRAAARALDRAQAQAQADATTSRNSIPAGNWYRLGQVNSPGQPPPDAPTPPAPTLTLCNYSQNLSQLRMKRRCSAR